MTDLGSPPGSGNLFSLVGSTALVAGAASGIGKATAAALRTAGAHVAMIDRDEAALRAAAAEHDEGVLALVADVTDRDAVDAAVGAALKRFGRPDVVVANAGYGRHGAFSEIDAKVWQRHLDVNLTGTFHVVQAAVREMSGGGSIILTGSSTSMSGCDLFSAYATTKAGVAMLARSLASELGPQRIRVNAVLPGVIESHMTESMLDDPATRRLLEQETPLGRLGRPDDVADVIVFLASRASRYVTGSSILVDGGQTAHGFPRWFSADAAAGGAYEPHAARMRAFGTTSDEQNGQ